MDGTLMPIDVGVVWVEFLAQKAARNSLTLWRNPSNICKTIETGAFKLSLL